MIYFCGDIHGDFRHLHQLVHASPRPDAVILLGDIEADKRPLLCEIESLLKVDVDVRFIFGNHDSDKRKAWDHLESAMHLNFHGKVVEIDGKRIAGLGGIFRSEIWYPPEAPKFQSYAEYCQKIEDKRPIRLRKREAREASLRHWEHTPGANAAMIDEIRYGKELRHKSSIFWDTYEALWDQQADILVVHEAPSCHPHGFEAIDLLAQNMGVKSLFHGHHHDRLDYSACKLGFEAYGVGLRGITSDSGVIVKAGELDHARSDRCGS